MENDSGKSFFIAKLAILPLISFNSYFNKADFSNSKQPCIFPLNLLLQGFTVIGISLNFDKSNQLR